MRANQPVPARFRITLTGSTLDVVARSNITPGELGRLLEHALTGGQLVDLRSWGLDATVEAIDANR